MTASSSSEPASPSGLLARGDALEVCARLPERVRFDLVYLDPPFGVGTQMAARAAPGQRRGARGKESGPLAYDDLAGGPELVSMLAPRLDAIRSRMEPHATLYLHLDHRTVHEAKVGCDAVFGRGAFLGEVIWTPGNGVRGGRGFSVTHQTLLLYARSPGERRKVVYNAADPALREPYAETSLSMHFRQRDAEGRLYRERKVGGKTYRYYADAGRRLGSVWADLPAMVANTPLRGHAEATGYPTQKPEALLERIVRASSLPGMTVADLMCGSGTTLVAAFRLGRRFVGGDLSSCAFTTAKARLEAASARFELLDAMP